MKRSGPENNALGRRNAQNGPYKVNPNPQSKDDIGSNAYSWNTSALPGFHVCARVT